MRDDIYLIDIVARAVTEERASSTPCAILPIGTSEGAQRAACRRWPTISYGLEPPLIWRRQRLPTLTVQADLVPGIEAATFVKQMRNRSRQFAGSCRQATRSSPAARWRTAPRPGQHLRRVPGHAVSHDHHPDDAAQSFQRLFLVCPRHHWRIIGVCRRLACVRGAHGLRRHPRRHLVDWHGDPQFRDPDRPDRYQIDAGETPWQAVICATEHRLRPILLTAAAAILGMIPIAPTVFWGPMAYAVMGGLVVATLLTLVFLPALYVAWFRIKPPEGQPSSQAAPAAMPLAA